MKTCYYDLLGVSSTADELELKKAFRRKALQYHPDKNIQSAEEATETFAQIRAAYEVLSDPQERAWYDSHRLQILKGDSSEGDLYNDDGDYAMDTGITSEELTMFTNPSLYTRLDDTPAGFYQIAGKIFARIAKDEILHGRISGFKKFETYDDDFFESKISRYGYVEACNHRIKDIVGNGSRCLFLPFGYSTTDYQLVKNFYKKWSSFSTVKSFKWKDEYMYSCTYDRRIKREINKRNAKIRQQYKNEYNKTVKSFIAFIKKMDSRIQVGDREFKRSQRERERIRLEELKRNFIQKGRGRYQFEPQNWQTIDEDKWNDLEELYNDDESESSSVREESDELIELVYDCFVCNKRFKSENQLENHNNTKAHKKNVRQTRRQMRKENFALGLDELSDLDEYASAGSKKDETSDDEDGDDGDDDDDQLKTLERELGRVEQQLENININSETRIPVDSEMSVHSADSTPLQQGRDLDLERLTILADEKRDSNLAINGGPSSKPKVKSDSNNEMCSRCGESFPSRNKLFNHLDAVGHASPPSNPRSQVKFKKKKRKKAK